MIKLNGHVITPTIFPDKTSQVWKIPESHFHMFRDEIVWEFEKEDEFMHLAQLVDLCNKKNKEFPDLFMPFLPYGRQDKEVSNEATFARSTFLKLLRTLKINSTSTLDAHSDISWVNSKSPIEHIKVSIREVGPNVIVFPDEGAKDRYETMLGAFSKVHCRKNRNQETGEILSMEIVGYDLRENDRVLIVDDIADGGRTFIEVAKILQQKNISDINLYTTHGIYSKGIPVLRDAGIKRIFNYKGEVWTKEELAYKQIEQTRDLNRKLSELGVLCKVLD